VEGGDEKTWVQPWVGVNNIFCFFVYLELKESGDGEVSSEI